MKDLRKFYIDTYRDQFFINPPAWFMMYMWMEALYHVPLSIWAIGALLRGAYRQATRKARDNSGLATTRDADLQYRLRLVICNSNSEIKCR
jgi:hypothetical protein